MLNCEQTERNATIVGCSSADWSDIRGCVSKLSEKDAVTYGLFLGIVGPLCTYLENDIGVKAAFYDMIDQVKASFYFDETKDFSFSYLGKVITGNFLPLYTKEFYSREFLVLCIWGFLSALFGGSTSCHMAIVGLFIIEIIILFFRRSYLGFIFELIFLGDHLLIILLLNTTGVPNAIGTP